MPYGSLCAICGQAILPADRAIFLGVERLLLHGGCYDDALDRGRADLVRAVRREQSR